MYRSASIYLSNYLSGQAAAGHDDEEVDGSHVQVSLYLSLSIYLSGQAAAGYDDEKVDSSHVHCIGQSLSIYLLHICPSVYLLSIYLFGQPAGHDDDELMVAMYRSAYIYLFIYLSSIYLSIWTSCCWI